jgi:hypothetical protein
MRVGDFKNLKCTADVREALAKLGPEAEFLRLRWDIDALGIRPRNT